MSATAHMGIEVFSMYRDGYTRKRDQKPCTYAAIFKTAAYDAAHKDLQESNGHFGQILMQDGARVARTRAW